jgi:LemA protein
MPQDLVIAALIVIALLGAWLIVEFNRLVRDRNLMLEAWSGIDVQLKRRHNLVPNLVEAVRGYSAHERGVLEDVTRARSQSAGAASIADREEGENSLSQGLKSLLAVAEAYPDLKADKAYLELQGQLVEVEDQIQYARRYYNGTVRNYNTRTESFPGNLVAAIFRFSRAPFFQVETATDREAPKVET